MMRTPFSLAKLNLADTSLPRRDCREIVKLELDQDHPDDRAKLARIAAWLESEMAPGTWRQWTNPTRDCWSFGFADPVLAVQFRLIFG